MQGDLDQPPIIIMKSRSKSLLMMIVSAAFSLSMFLIWPGVQGKLSAWLVLPGWVLFTLGVPLFAWELIRPEQLILSPSGLEWRGIRKTITYDWNELSEFSVYSIRGSKLIGFTAPSPGGLRGFLARFNTTLTGKSAALPGLWEIEPKRLAEILNAARTKWSSQVQRKV